ncbi:MAG: DNA polymerase III subunit beta [Candidatus Cloacimonas sp. 4484_275]|nr:MAG: DNA polymerase III subunit beta [Candidatus Cloacimonas sp. 4484_275]RLC52131.1 MAG: DNA polymerase III subunit beta [Candidatus Cloacimonadota bacterium]
MKFSIEKEDLLKKIQHIYNIVPGKNTMPILTNYLIEAEETTNTVKFTATDLEITVVAEFEANISESGKVVVSAKNFNEIINSLPNTIVHMFDDEENFKILCKNSKFSLHCAEVSQFPLIPQKDLQDTIEVDAQMFKKMIEKTSFAVSSEINRPIFTGINWKMNADYQMMVATDGKKIAEFKLFEKHEIPEQKEKVIPTKSLNFLDKVIVEDIPKVSVLIESNRVMFAYGNYTVFTHIIEGNYPNYEKAIPVNNNNILIINRNLLRDVVKRVSLLASEETLKVKFDITEESFSVHSEKREEGEANEQIEEYKYSGENLVIAFNYRYLLSILNVIDSEEVEIRMGQANEPALFFNTEKYENYEARFLLMPLRLA